MERNAPNAEVAKPVGPDKATSRVRLLRTTIALLVLGGVFGFIYYNYGDHLSLSTLAEKEADVRAFQQDHPVAVFGIAFLVYAGMTGLLIPGAATVLTLSYGWFFGFPRAVILVSFASTTGATIAFLLSRFLFRDLIQNRFGDRLAGFNRALEREGAFYLFTLRLIPAVPFFVINVVMGLTSIKTITYGWVSQVGMFPGTCIYVYAGSAVPAVGELVEQGTGGIMKPQILIAFVLLGLFPIAVKKIVGRYRSHAESRDRRSRFYD